MGTLLQDLRYAVRTLSKSPGFAAIAILTLGLGIGANTALFSVVNGVLLNPLPYPHPDQVVSVADKTSDFPESSISYPNFLDWLHLNHSFASLAAYRQTSFNLTGQGDAERVTAMEVSASFFPLLGVNPVAGRNFSTGEDQLNGAPAVILSGGFWKRKFGSSPEIIGKALNLNGTDYTVVGVIPENFYFCCETINFNLSDVYVPIGGSKNPWMLDRRIEPGIRAIGRIKQGVALAQARADMDGVARSLALAYPEADKDVGIVVTPLKEVMVRDIQPFLLVLLAAVGFVLLIACVNVANLLLARSMGRAREFAIRAALGATQGRVIRQLLTESILLAIAGGALGLLLASWGTNAALAVLPSALPRANDVRMDLRVLLFTLAVSLLAGILFGLAPALKTSHPDLHEALKEGGRGASGARYRTQGVFVIVEMALAVVLLVGAGLTIRTLVGLWSVNPGFDPHNVLSFNIGFPPRAGADPAAIRANLRQFTEKIAAVPGVSSVSLMDGALPLTGDNELPFWLEGQPKPPSEENMSSALWYDVGSDYLKVMKIPLLRGRFLTEQDNANSPSVCVIDEDFARKFLPHQDPIGRRLNFDLVYTQLEIVGVVGHVKQFGLDEGPNPPVDAQLYTAQIQFPYEQMKAFGSATGYVVRTAGSPLAVAGAIRDAIREFNSKAVFYRSGTMDQIISQSLETRRFAMILLAVFAVLALLLSSIGIYGVISYVVGQRTHEIGIRVALGAQRSDVLKIVLGQATRLALMGVVIGLAASAALTRLMAKILYGVSASDPLTFAFVAVVLLGVALLACYVPARRAMRVDPIVALRYE
ncbi:MAG TPA: ABC transporter permease [Candidatus Acidoferrales bacterium]|nr:ABC transporter permease [Candidatus Acidoferrales bacterium]